MKRYGQVRRIQVRDGLSRHYYVRVFDTRTGKRAWRSTGRASLRAAEEQKRAWERQDALGKADAEEIGFHKAVGLWLEFKSSTMSAGGLRAYGCYAKSWCAFFPERIAVGAIDPELVEGYFRRRGLEVSNATLNKERLYLGQFFRWAKLRNWAESYPLTTVGRFTEPRREIRALTDAEEAELLRACRTKYKLRMKGKRNAGGRAGQKSTLKPRIWEQAYTPPGWLYPLVFLAARTGLRYGSLVVLEWGDVDLARRVIRVAPEKLKAREALTVPLDDATVALLRELKQRATTLHVLDVPDAGCARRAFREAVKRAGLPATRFHDLRASFISRCRRAGIDLEITARLAGHRDIKTTLKFYRRIEETELRDAVTKLSATRSGPAATETKRAT